MLRDPMAISRLVEGLIWVVHVVVSLWLERIELGVWINTS
jgi:hypothetical protein